MENLKITLCDFFNIILIAYFKNTLYNKSTNFKVKYMNIKEIENPKFLKKMNNKQLELLASDIRTFLIDNISKTGGHLSSNLGIVELTIMLHKVFTSPKDKIIFDVSHQSYVHKILTGRAKDFDKLRKFNGLSGFQNRSESIHDVYEAGHSSTSISAAVGFAIGRDMNKKHNKVIAVIGDGSICNGLCYEALNQIGEEKQNLIIILNDNNMSISKNVGAMHNHLDKIRINQGYDNTKTKTKKILSKIPIFGNFTIKAIQNIKKSLKKIYIKEGFIFEELGITYFGPINGHDFNELEMYLTRAKKAKGPVLIHVITEKGKGYKYAYEDKIGFWHGVGPFNKETGELITSNNGLISWSKAICNILIELFNKDLVVITPAMEQGSKLTDFKEKYPKNFIDVGIAEEHSLIVANALSLEGKIPFVSIYSSFLQRGYDQIVHDIAKMNSHVILGIDRSGITGEDGSTHQGVFDITFLLPIPNMIITCPKDVKEAANLLKTALITKSPFAIRYSKEKIKYQLDNITPLEIGSWEKITSGKDATIITYGTFVNEALKIIELLKKDGYKVELVNARFIKPIDKKYFKKIENKNKPIFVYEESMTIGSLGSYLKTISKKNITIMGIDDVFIPQGTRKELLKWLKLDELSIYQRIKKVLKEK